MERPESRLSEAGRGEPVKLGMRWTERTREKKGGGLWPLALGSECGGSGSEAARTQVSGFPARPKPSVPPPMSSAPREQRRR